MGDDWKRTAIVEASKQGPSFVVLLLILAGGTYLGQYALRDAIPAHLKSIQDGYESLEKKQEKAAKVIADELVKNTAVSSENTGKLEKAIQENGRVLGHIDSAIRKGGNR